MKLKRISEQVVVIVGASSGIGRLAAQRFAERGAKVIAAARGEEGLSSLADHASRMGGSLTTRVADVTDPKQMEELADFAVKTHGRIDSWVHVAGVLMMADFDATTVEDFRQVQEVNLIGPFNGIKAALPHLRQSGGALIAVSSVEGKIAFPWQSAYAASKHGLTGLLDALRIELSQAKVNVSVTNIMPATIDTPIFEKARTKVGYQPQGAPPVYPPEAVVNAILYAAEHPVRQLTVGGAGKMMLAARAISPGFADWLLGIVGLSQQKMDTPKSPSAPDNLYGPVKGLDRVEGNLGQRPVSVSTWVRTHPWTSLAIAAGAGLVLTALLEPEKVGLASDDDDRGTFDRVSRWTSGLAQHVVPRKKSWVDRLEEALWS